MIRKNAIVRWTLALSATVLLFLAATAGAYEVNLRAEATTMTMPDGEVIAMWGFALDDGPVQIPGPQITVPAGDTTLTIHLQNNLYSAPVSIVIPGQTASPTPVYRDGVEHPELAGRVESFSMNVAPGATGDFTWTGFREGAFLYHSGNHPQEQVQMGLYGCVKKDVAAGQAYTGVTYDNEVVVLWSEIDPAVHAAVATGNYGPDKEMTSTVYYRPKYFLVNGIPYTEGVVALPAGNTGETTLIRMVNAGIKAHTPMLNGAYFTHVADNSFELAHKPLRYVVTLQPMTTQDILFQPSATGTYMLYDRTLHLSNSAAVPGGLMVPLEVGAAIP